MLQAAPAPLGAQGSIFNNQDGRAAAPQDFQALCLGACWMCSKKLLQSAGTGKTVLPWSSSPLS